VAAKPLSDSVMRQTLAQVEKYGSVSAAAREMGLSRSTLATRFSESKLHQERLGVARKKAVEDFSAEAQDRIQELELSIKLMKESTLSDEYVKKTILKLDTSEKPIPKWLVTPKAGKSPGVPTLFISDTHHGEIIDPAQINNVNEYNIAIAHRRYKTLVEKTISLCFHHIANPSYPGIVVVLGGDMVSGDIHDELVATNEKEIMACVIDLYGVLVWVIETLRDKFGQVFLPCVTGNHGRDTHKIRAKGRNFTSFDWLLYQFLAKRFEGDKRVQFHIPDGADALFSVFGYRYLLTHGDQFRGGDGVIGALGPIIRGDHKKRSRNGQIGMSYDTMLLGHWHQLIQLERLVVNGSLCGYNEYAMANNFGFEPPRQALWLTHPDQGITFRMAVNVDDTRDSSVTKDKKWVSWAQ